MTAVTREVSEMTRGRLFGVELPVREPIRLDKRRKRRATKNDPRQEAGEARTEFERLAKKIERYSDR
jgi:hypothetical protein